MKLALLLFLLAADQLPEAPGKATIVKVCSTCHGPEAVTGMGHDRAGWKDLVSDMVDKGAVANEKQVSEIVDYLVRAFPKKPR